MLPAVLSAGEDRCKDPITTPDINYCAYQEVLAAEEVMDRYLAASRERFAEEPEVVAAIDTAQESWLEYRDKHCGSVYTLWSGGSVRGLMANQCRLDSTEHRTYELWQAFLTFMDSTPPVLPEPKRDSE
ncbi:hypothetical protein CAI21_20655 [Alkalilimnicola ehrlichii]|uniref:Lysozyme inhibitor LprI-like N-terminal domain-containing protein n=2 Tax=Alkalilimnicola ehrlichii TaxID=351052 RepID=A0A3E0WIX3_9GAMM|nr:hypothetical protein CAI21_20655 [Alkalilimnicola ehrlichii]RFA31815.1 hypothetical protein CAL65_21420 [Alkalilimnicola ehrlichii]